MCRYSYGGKYCAHRMVAARECIGEMNCMERAAPSYHCRSPVAKADGAHLRPHLGAFCRTVDLHLISFGAPLGGSE